MRDRQSRDDRPPAVTDGNTPALRLLADRRGELSQQRRQAANRLHRHLRELVPGGTPLSLAAGDTSKLLGAVRPSDPVAVAVARKHVAHQLTTKIRRLDKELSDNR